MPYSISRESKTNIDLKYPSECQIWEIVVRISHRAKSLFAFWVKLRPSQITYVSGLEQTGTPRCPHIFLGLKLHRLPIPQHAVFTSNVALNPNIMHIWCQVRPLELIFKYSLTEFKQSLNWPNPNPMKLKIVCPCCMHHKPNQWGTWVDSVPKT